MVGQPAKLTVTGLSHRLKQITHFNVSSSRSVFLLLSAAFFAGSFLLPAAAAEQAIEPGGALSAVSAVCATV